MATRDDKLNASAAALKAIDYISNQEFQQLEAIQKQFMWSCFYFYGFNVLEPAKTQFKGVDPRSINYQDPSNTTWLDFAYKNQVDRKFIYINPGNMKAEQSDFIQTADKIIVACDLLTTKSDIGDTPFIAAYIAGLLYLGKWDTFKKWTAQTYNVYESTLNKLKTTMDQRIKENLQLLATLTGYNSDELKSTNGGFFMPSASYATSSLKQLYIESKAQYEAKVKELFNIIKDTPSLTICYQNASVGDVEMGGEDNLAYVKTNQILNCAGDLIAEEVTNDKNDEMLKLLEKIQQMSIELKDTNAKFEEVQGLMMTKNNVIKLIDSKIDENINVKKQQIVGEQTTSLWLIIILIVLFLFSLVSLIFSLKNSRKISEFTTSNPKI